MNPRQNAATGLRLREKAVRKRLNVSYDPIRADFDLNEADSMDRQAMALLTPAKPLQEGAGGEIVPPTTLGLPGLEYALQRPNMLSVEASIQRTELADKAGVFELAIEAAESSKAKGAVQKMLTHQMAAAHKHAMRLLGESEKERDSIEKCRMATTASKLMDAFSRAAVPCKGCKPAQVR